MSFTVDLTTQQYEWIVTTFSFAIGVMGIASLFFFSQRKEVLPRYRVSIIILSLISAVATFNYVMIYLSWREAAVVTNDSVMRTGVPYNDIYRYADWLTTVPLLLVAFVCVLDLPLRQVRMRSILLGLLGAEMVVLGYFGQVATSAEARWLWFGIGMIPFMIIQFQLYGTLGKVIDKQPSGARLAIKMARLGFTLFWPIYAIVYVLPLLGLTGPTVFVGIQIGYAVADIASKAFYGTLIWMAAMDKSGVRTELPEWQPASARSLTNPIG